MRDDMVERVARAIFENDAESGFDFSNPKTFWRAEGSYWPDHVWEAWTRVARAAIQAMREPTEDMCDEAECATPFSFEAMWKAAIDEALRQKDASNAG